MRYFMVARRSAMKSTYIRHKEMNSGKIKIGAAIVKGNYVISSGFNKIKTHPLQQLHNKRVACPAPSPRIHAEIDALIYSRYDDLTSCEIFVYRESSDGMLANCRPCSACSNALKDAGVKHIYYTSERGYHYERI